MNSQVAILVRDDQPSQEQAPAPSLSQAPVPVPKPTTASAPAPAPAPAPEPAPASPLSSTAKIRILLYIFLLQRVAIIYGIVWIRTKWMPGNEHQSAFENNLAFKKTGIVAFYALIFIATSLSLCLKELMPDGSYTLSKFIGSFSAFLAVFSLTMELVLPSKLTWVGYLLVCVIFGIMVTCFWFDDHQQETASPLLSFNSLVLVLVLIVTFAACCIPTNLNRIAYIVIYVSLGMEIAYHCITCIMFIIDKAIRHSQNTYHLTYLMQIRGSLF
ncbi:hypothetical protein M8C21_031165 [Ambrosia artemisiifolia]|uniref:Uncharacterized protein n=1 Tax=Ambrosia artemisiifolia TaxID=4212 RepID=A0AAD5CEZ7_AMBAR|nr:hypothetical protein M8C21_031165 [Ambrosia artemisiifolia]